MLKAYLAEKKELVEKNLQKILERYEKPELYSEAMKYAVMNGGKRLRPILMYMMCDLFGKKYETILPAHWNLFIAIPLCMMIFLPWIMTCIEGENLQLM